MKLKDGVVISDIGDEYMLISSGVCNTKFSGALILNEVSYFVLNQLKEEKTYESLLDSVLSEYDVSREIAERDLNKIIEEMKENDLLTL